MSLLVAVGTSAAYLYALVALFSHLHHVPAGPGNFICFFTRVSAQSGSGCFLLFMIISFRLCGCSGPALQYICPLPLTLCNLCVRATGCSLTVGYGCVEYRIVFGSCNLLAC
jgi:hypothetical protein